jgi:hypothetical protein
MNGWITLTHFMSGDKIHFQVVNITTIRESQRAVVIITLDGKGTYVVESVEQIAGLMSVSEIG